MDIVRQGRSYTFGFELSGQSASAMTVVASVKQYPDDSPAISRTLSYISGEFVGTLTGADTAALDTGQWFITCNATDSDEDISDSIKIYITKGWA